MKTSNTLIIFIQLAIFLSVGFLQSQNTSSPCKKNNPLSFLIGNWKYEEYFLKKNDTTLHGKSNFHIKDFYGCGIYQKWDGTDENDVPNFKATSTITFNDQQGIWLWNNVRRFEDGKVTIGLWKGQKVRKNWQFIFERVSNKSIKLVRVTWDNPNRKQFYSFIEVSEDFGKTWKKIAYGVYKKVE